MSFYTSNTALDLIAIVRDEVYQRQEPAVMITVVRAVGSSPQNVGSRLVLFHSGDIKGTVGGGKIEAMVLEEAKLLLRESAPPKLCSYNLQQIGMTCGGAMDFFIERVDPAPMLFIFGGGHVAQPTAALAQQCGFCVTVIDPRSEWASAERFPCATVVNQSFADFLANYRAQANHYLVLVSQGHAHDQQILEAVIGGQQRYTGVIGSKRKARELWQQLQTKGITEAQWQAVHCPIGVPIGGSMPVEIAVSIVAQLIQIRRATDLDQNRATSMPQCPMT
jgi:xanthine dehydrogenase accessory factor